MRELQRYSALAKLECDSVVYCALIEVILLRPARRLAEDVMITWDVVAIDPWQSRDPGFALSVLDERTRLSNFSLSC